MLSLACGRLCRRGETVEEQQALALAAAEDFANDDVRHCQGIGVTGEAHPQRHEGLTHCNAAGWRL